MPKIDAPSVAEHRAQVQARLVDAAEALLRDGEQLTAGAVTSSAGIARNSIYRYVDSVDDLRLMVVSRYLPGWMEAIAAALDGLTPAEQVPAWVAVNIRQAASTGHAWLMDAGRTATPSALLEETVAQAHAGVQGPLLEAWHALLGDEEHVRVAVALTVGLLDGAFGRLEAGTDEDLLVELCSRAARGLVEALAGS